ncbi:carboxylesterase/lipase family protein [Streptomyces tremellae]|uniref:Carboxylic ester hydrolase n=1 Tax=Streptomyces tremellae TaxID=1124239 RepID=A0ABP7G0W2_9ACTN
MSNVRIEHGALVGTSRDGVHSFLGIPYAAPPTGELRWAPPAPPAAWEGTRDATAFGDSAIQSVHTGLDPGSPQSEDCLSLNVWTTDPAPGVRLPVMVWIHGGGFLNGSSAMPLWSGQHLARRGVVVVTLNYRLGAFGFLAHPEAGSNVAVQDWVAALDWVRRDIAVFGGDPDNVTVFGQSAGGAACRALLCTPSARGLFHRAVMQSAGYEKYAVVASPDHERVTDATERLFRHLGTSDLARLRRLPAERIRAASFAGAGVVPPPGQVHTPANLVWYPAADGRVVTEDFTGRADGVPVMFGCTQDEARMFHRPTGLYGPASQSSLDPADVYTSTTLTAMAEAIGGDAAGDVLAHFRARGLSLYEALCELDTAGVWHEPALTSYRRYAALDDLTAYQYRFTRVSPAAHRTGLLAQHGAEIPYLFGPVTVGDDYDATDVQVSDAVQHAWTEFARTGTPRDPDGTPWPACTSGDSRFTVIGDKTEHVPLDITPVCELITAQRRPRPTAPGGSGAHARTARTGR